MRIVHISFVRKLTHGQTMQLRFEHDSAQSLEGMEWTTLAYHNGPISEPYMRPIPPVFRILFMRQLWGWIVALRLNRTHDLVMMRHMAFDPFAFVFAPLIRNRVSVHHAKDVEELRLIRVGWKGRAAAWLEQKSVKFAVRRAIMVLGVTQEIAEYVRNTYAPGKKIGVYSNGVDILQVPVIHDKRVPREIHTAFICGTFAEWHGLDKLIDAVDEHSYSGDDFPFVIHLIGRLSEKQIAQLSVSEIRRSVFKIYGVLTADEYISILEKCDFGMTSFALERAGVFEGSTLKVREMLAMGLPVYSGHEDVALPRDENFVKITEQPKVSEMIAFAKDTKSISRIHVREISTNRIEKRRLMWSTSQIFQGQCVE
jgi:glycosyltransferase involved in cell wall biosynthesis